MGRFVEGTDRGQNTLFPECLEDWIGEDNPVHDLRIGPFGCACLHYEISQVG